MALLFCNDLLSTASSHKDAKRSQCFALPELPGAEPPDRLSDREERLEHERRRGGDSGPKDDDPFADRDARRRRALGGVPLLPFGGVPPIGGVGLEQHGATFSGRASSKPTTARRRKHPSTAPPGPSSARLGAVAAARRAQQALEEGLADQPQLPSQQQQAEDSDGLLLGSDAFGSLWDEWRYVLSPASKLVAQKSLALAGGPGSQATTSAASLGPKASTHSGAWRSDRKGVALPSLTGTARDTGGSAGAWARAAHHKEWERPGSQLTGRLAIAEGGSLSAQYSLICKEDVTKACSRQDVASRSAAARRRDCAAKQGRLARQRAARWRGRATDATSIVGTPKMSRRHSLDHASLQHESDGESEPQDGDAQRSDEHDEYPRWKRALDRIAARDTEKEDEILQKQLTGGLEGEGQPQQPPQLQQQEQHTEDLARLFVSHVKSEKDGGGCAGEPPRLGWRRKNQATLDAHIASLHRLRKIEERVKKLQRTQDARQRRFYQLPQEERQMCLDVFKYCCKDDEQADALVLNAAQLRLCAVEAGLGGIGSEEQVAVLNLCEEASRSPNEIVYNAGGDCSGPLFEVKTGVNLFTFACSFLPSIRKALQFIRSERLEDIFDERDLEQKGSLDLKDCCAIAATFSGCRDDAAIRQMATEIMEEDQLQQQQKEANDRQNTESPRRSLMDSNIAKNFRRTQGTRQLTRKEEEPPPTMSGDQLKRLVDVVCQHTRRKFHDCERGLQGENKLDEGVFLRLRPDMPMLMKLYQRRKAKPRQASEAIVTPGAHEGLSTEGCMQVLLEFGLRDKRRSSDRGGSDLEVVQGQAEKARKQGERMISFKTLLSIVEKVRRKREFHEYESLQDTFMSFAASESRIGATAEQPIADGMGLMLHRGDDAFGTRPKYIPLMSASKFIEWARCFPRRRELPEAMAQALEDHLTYSTECLQHKDIPPGTIGFPALVRVLQRTSEYLARLDFARDAKVAVDHGFQASELAQLHSVFDKLDDDSSGTLSKMEVCEAIKNMGFKLKTSQFETVFKQCDVDRSGSIEFLEFVGLLGLARDEVGGFSQNRPITLLTDLKQMEVQRLLGFYGRTSAVVAEGKRRHQVSPERLVGQTGGHGASKEAPPEEDAPDPRDLEELCDCLGVSTGASLLETIKVQTVQELFSFALTRIDDASE